MNGRSLLLVTVLVAAAGSSAHQTGKIRWSRVRSGGAGGNGILTTAGGLLFTNESGRLVALDAATGKLLWHVDPGGNMSGAPMTYELGGRQYVLTPVGGWLYAWALPDPARVAESYSTAPRSRWNRM